MSMVFALTHRIEASSTQRAVALRDKVAELLEAEDEVTVISSSQAQDDDAEFMVSGFDLEADAPFTQTVTAASADAAEAAVATETKKVAVVSSAA